MMKEMKERLARLFGRQPQPQAPAPPPAPPAPPEPGPGLGSPLLEGMERHGCLPQGRSWRALCTEPAAFTAEQQLFLEQMEERATILRALCREPHRLEGIEEAAPRRPEWHAGVSGDGLQAWLFLFPPCEGEEELTAQGLEAFLQEQGVVWGIDSAALEEAARRKLYFRLFIAARGQAAVDGVDGLVTDHFSRRKTIHLEQDDRDTIDYKDLNWIQRVQAGEIICDVRPAVPGREGMSVRGVVLPCKNGVMPPIPEGENTQMREDGTALTALCDGQVSFAAGRFRVSKILCIDENVDIETGNLDVLGDVLIGGNVEDGFTVKATGNVTVRGLVEGAFIEAGGDIQVGTGVKGNSKGTLRAGGSVRCKYIENANILAGGCVYADSIVNSTVSSSDKVLAEFGRGVIIGGCTTALRGIEARVIGNESSRQTALVVGVDPAGAEKAAALREELAQLERTVEERRKSMAYLEQNGYASDENRRRMDELRLQISVAGMRRAKLEKQLQQLETQADPTGQITAGRLWPPVSVTIGKVKTVLTDSLSMCRLYESGGKIQVGSK